MQHVVSRQFARKNAQYNYRLLVAFLSIKMYVECVDRKRLRFSFLDPRNFGPRPVYIFSYKFNKNNFPDKKFDVREERSLTMII